MKVLFLTEKFIVEPLGIAYLASVLKKHGYDVDLIRVDLPDSSTQIKKSKPDILAYSVTTGKHKKFLALNKVIKEEIGGVSIFGGSHPTYYPEMVHENGVDFIVRGEAEKSFIKLLDKIRLFKSSSKVIEFSILEQNLDKIPFPDREFLYKYEENRNNPIKNIITSRGCPYNCKFCFNSLYRSFYSGQHWVRYRSPENVIQECIALKKYPLEMIYFQDDELLSNPKIYELLDLYKKEIQVPFHCQLRIELLTEDLAKKLKDCGCNSVTFAIESGNEEIRKKVLGKYISNEKILKGSEILHKIGLKFRTENMIGLPTETLENIIETIDINIKCNPTYGWASIFQPYPRLPLGEQCKELKIWDGGINHIKETFFEDTVLNIKHKKEVVNIQRLFGLIVRYPRFKKLFFWLIKLSTNRVFNKLYFWWKAKVFNNELYKVEVL